MSAQFSVLGMLGLMVLFAACGQRGVTPEQSETTDDRPSDTAQPVAAVPLDAAAVKKQQQASADDLGVAVEITNSIGMKLKLIPAGEFVMGSRETPEELAKVFAAHGAESEWFTDEQPSHRVRMTKPFYLGAHEVTVGQFRRFVEATGYKTEAETDGKGGYGTNEQGTWEQKPEYTWRNPSFTQTDEHPVVNVSWNDTQAFIAWLGKTESKQYRLPTEAEWEYACRAGTTSRYCCGDDAEKLAQVGNVADASAKQKFPTWTWTISGRDGYVFTAPVGQFQPNAFGLHDMHGNVWEWCADRWASDYYAVSPTDDPQGPSSGALFRMFRGGCWASVAGYCRAACRFTGGPQSRDYDLGFRVAAVPPGGQPSSSR
jgi:formylglycine-generating enzyme required for sulfatase activity